MRSFGTILLLWSVVALSRHCDADEAQHPEALGDLWANMLSDEPDATRAVLAMSLRPEEAVPFLKDRLQPLELTQERLRKLIGELGSEDDHVWQAAFDRLEYFDPRLAMKLDELMNLEAVGRSPVR